MHVRPPELDRATLASKIRWCVSECSVERTGIPGIPQRTTLVVKVQQLQFLEVGLGSSQKGAIRIVADGHVAQQPLQTIAIWVVAVYFVLREQIDYLSKSGNVRARGSSLLPPVVSVDCNAIDEHRTSGSFIGSQSWVVGGQLVLSDIIVKESRQVPEYVAQPPS